MNHVIDAIKAGSLRKLEDGERIRIIDGGLALNMVVIRRDEDDEHYYRIGHIGVPTDGQLEQREFLYGADETERLIHDLHEVRADAARSIERLKQLEPSAA